MVFSDQSKEEIYHKLLRTRLKLLEYANNHSFEEVLREILKEIGNLTESPVKFFHFIEDDSRLFSAQEWLSIIKEEFKETERTENNFSFYEPSELLENVDKGNPCIYNNETSEYKNNPHDATNSRMLIVPVLKNKQVVSILGIANKTFKYSDKDVEIACFLADIAWVILTEKKQEQRLIQSEEKYRKLFQNHSAVKIIIDPYDGRIVDANNAAADFYGWGIDILKKMKIKDINILPDAEVQKRLEEAKYLRNTHFIFKHRKANGQIVDIENFSSKIYINGKELLHSVIHDITEKTEAEKQLVESEKLNKALIKSIPFAMDIVDDQGRILFQNEHFKEDFTADQVNHKCFELYRDNKKQCNNCPLKEGLKVGKTKTIEASGILGGRIFQITHTGMIYKGKNAILEIFTDITEQKKSKSELIVAKTKAEESNRIKSAFLATISHELRTPLNSVIGFSDIIKDTSVDPEIKEYAGIIFKSGQGLLELIDDIFNLALMENGKIKLRPTTFPFRSLFQEMQVELKEILDYFGKADNIKLSFTAEKHILDKKIISDKGKIAQVLTNLIKNAVKFTEKGFIEFGLKQNESGNFTFFIQDSGIGISPEKHKIIFDFFRQEDSSLTRKYGGVGIGLAIASKIALAMNGILTVESEPGRGSLFSFTFPAEEASFNGESPLIKSGIPNLKGFNILLVEDDQLNMLLLRKLLIPTGAHLLKANTGKEAIRLFEKENKIDLVLMDMKMPEINGFEATRTIKSNYNNIPIIAQTSFSFSREKRKTLEAGCDGIITKPYNKRKLYKLMEFYLNSRP